MFWFNSVDQCPLHGQRREQSPRLDGGPRPRLADSRVQHAPSSTNPRKKRERDGKVDGRTTEIQRLIGRALRAIVDLDALGERTIVCDCEVLEADGGTRTASITGAYVALQDALSAIAAQLDPARPVLFQSIAAVSVGIVNGAAVLLDLDYKEDVDAEVDMNVVMTGGGRYIEIQGTGEEATFDEAQLAELLS